jgi:hypothetical protein
MNNADERARSLKVFEVEIYAEFMALLLRAPDKKTAEAWAERILLEECFCVDGDSHTQLSLGDVDILHVRKVKE